MEFQLGRKLGFEWERVLEGTRRLVGIAVEFPGDSCLMYVTRVVQRAIYETDRDGEIRIGIRGSFD